MTDPKDSCQQCKVDGSEAFELEDDIVASVISNSFFYSPLKIFKNSMNVKEVPDKLVFSYKCDSNQCHFPVAAIQENEDLKACGVQDTTALIVKTLQDYPNHFKSRQCGGYILSSAGKPTTFLRNESVTVDDDTRFGCADVIRARQQLIHEAKFQKMVKNDEKYEGLLPTNRTLFFSYFTGCAFGAGSLLFFLKLAKRL